MDSIIKQFVCRVRARLREQQIIANLIKFVGIGLLAAVVISFISLVIPFYYAVPVAVGIVAVFFIVGMIRGICKAPSLMEAALQADAKGHKEKISTAFFLQNKEDPFSVLQKKDALKVMEAFSIRKEFPIRFRWKQVLLVLGLALLFGISSMIDTPAREAAMVRNEVTKEAKEDIAHLEKVEKKLENSSGISKAEAAEIKEQIETAKKELSKADSRADLKKAEERITKKMEMASEKTENRTLSEILNDAAKEAKEASGKKEDALAKEAKEALAKAEKGNKRDKQEAYKKLKKFADTIGDEALKKAVEEYKESSYSENDYANTERAFDEALDNMASDWTDLAENQNNTNSSNKSNQSNCRNNCSQSNNQNSNQSGSGNQNRGQNSSSQNNNQNGNQNCNTGNGENGQGNSGQNGSGNGSGYGNGSGGNGSGSGWNYGGKEGREGTKKTNENITVPDGKTGNDENLTGKANGNNSSTKEKSNQSKTWSGNKVSYGEVSGEYKKKAYKKVNGSDYPGKLKDKIKNYFDGLN